MKEIMKLARVILTFLLIVCMFFKWLHYDASSSGYSSGFSLSGFAMIGQSLISILLLVIPVVFIGIQFNSSFEKYQKAIFPLGSVVGIVITLLMGWLVPKFLTLVSVDGVSQECTWGIGLWLTIIDYVLIFIVSLIIDFNISKENMEKNGVSGMVKNVKKEMSESVTSLVDEVNKR